MIFRPLSCFYSEYYTSSGRDSPCLVTTILLVWYDRCIRG